MLHPHCHQQPRQANTFAKTLDSHTSATDGERSVSRERGAGGPGQAGRGEPAEGGVRPAEGGQGPALDHPPEEEPQATAFHGQEDAQ